NAFKSQRPSVLGKPTTFSNSFIRKDFSKSTSVTNNNESNDFSKPVTAQTLPMNKKSYLKNTNVLAPGMYKIHTDHTQARTSKLPQDSKKTNKRVSFSTGVISTTSVSRPQLKSNPQGNRVLRSNSCGKKLEVEEPHRNVKLSKNKLPVTVCTANLNAKTVNVKSVSAMCAKSVMINKHDLRVPKYVAKPLRKTVAYESIKKPRNNVRKLNDHFGKTHKWTYIKFTPSGYMWKPKYKQANVNPNVSMPLVTASRTANVKDTMTYRRSTVSNTPLSSNSFVAEITDFKTKNKSLTEANNKLSEVNAHLYADYKKSKDELKRRNTAEYATEMELKCAKLRELQHKLSAHQDTISVLKQQKDAQIKLYKTREDKDIEKVIDLENKVKDLKAQLQDKGIAISELKKLIEKLKGKSVDTKFEKSSVIRQPNAFKSQRPSVLGKPTTFLNSFIRKDFSKSTSVTKNNVSNC
nr:hypothetical protein [Tanacetum cinerariifolium]